MLLVYNGVSHKVLFLAVIYFREKNMSIIMKTQDDLLKRAIKLGDPDLVKKVCSGYYGVGDVHWTDRSLFMEDLGWSSYWDGLIRPGFYRDDCIYDPDASCHRCPYDGGC